MGLREEGYWNEHYKTELNNFEEDGDEGEVWFGRGLSGRIVEWIIKEIESQLVGDGTFKPKIIDIGCGNAFILYTLMRRIQSTPNESSGIRALGIDYSINSIELSKKIVNKQGFSHVIEIKHCDFLNPTELSSVTGSEKFDYIIDKGTLDAICLIASNSESSINEAKFKYIESLYSLVKCGTTFIIASCNHTEVEIRQLFDFQCSLKAESKLIDRIETPKIKFGGVEGSQVTCLIFKFVN